MSIETITVRRSKEKFKRGKNLASETHALSTETLLEAVPSICKKDGQSDGLVNSKITISVGGRIIEKWLTEDVAAIIALDDA